MRQNCLLHGLLILVFFVAAFASSGRVWENPNARVAFKNIWRVCVFFLFCVCFLHLLLILVVLFYGNASVHKFWYWTGVYVDDSFRFSPLLFSHFGINGLFLMRFCVVFFFYKIWKGLLLAKTSCFYFPCKCMCTCFVYCLGMVWTDTFFLSTACLFTSYWKVCPLFFLR